jgi:predicted AAA+ superfamily ATPase
LVAHRLGYHTEEQIKSSPLAGSLFENLVISEILKRAKSNQQAGSFYHYRDKSGLEVDLIFENQSKLQLIEIKQNETPNIAFAQDLLRFATIVKNVQDLYLISPRIDSFVQEGVKFVHYKESYNPIAKFKS